MNVMSRITYRAAVAALRTIFVDPGKDILALDEIFRMTGRDPQQPERNKRWLQNRLITLRYYEFVTPIYTKGNPRRELVEIQLTPTGKAALANTVSSRAITLESIARDIKAFERQNPSMTLDFVARVRRND